MATEHESEPGSLEDFDQDAESDLKERFVTASGEFDLDQFLAEINRRLAEGDAPEDAVQP